MSRPQRQKAIEAREDRFTWIAFYMLTKEYVDILDEAFVKAYIEKFDAKHEVTRYGAFKCPALARDLKAMHDEYLVNRRRVGISGMAGYDLPKWVWSYSLTPVSKEVFK